MKIYLENAGATEALGAAVGNVLFSGAVVLLTGDLGAGKTLFSKGLAVARGVAAQDVVSPTFALMNVYNGDVEIRHFDLYRLQAEEELEDIGFDEYCGGEGITLIEWADLFLDRMPTEYLMVKIQRRGEGREAQLVAVGEEYTEVLEKLEC